MQIIFQLGFIEVMEAKKMHILFPAQWASDSTKLPEFLSQSHQQKMLEAFNDTRLVLLNIILN
jgi:hypothetical protein